VFDELLEPEATGFLHDLCEARVAALPHELSKLTGEPLWETDGDVSLSHSGTNPGGLDLSELLDSTSASVFHKVDDARVAVLTRDAFNLRVQVRWNRRCLPTRLLPVPHYKDLSKILLTINLIKVLQSY
jgi:hypothetical protein